MKTISSARRLGKRTRAGASLQRGKLLTNRRTKLYKRIMARWIEDIVRPFYYHAYLLRKTDKRHARLIEKIRSRGYANVVFFAANLSMWRYQGIYDLMKQDSRFRVTVLLTPFNSFTDVEKADNIRALKACFDSKGIEYEDTTIWPQEKYAIREWLDPDIMFYVQPYSKILGSPLDNYYFTDKLLCFAPYGVGTVAEPWSVNTRFQNLAWKLFYETEVYREVARHVAVNRGKNVVVVGNTNADIYLQPEHGNPWKEQPKPKKKIIWAPHFTIREDMLLHRGAFLWLNEAMIKIAQEYSDTIQFAFKPHPRLKTVLYSLPEWGKERTDIYYQTWATMPNTQLEESAFIDLFMTSDAMIHDCASFTVEYHYSKNPCLFTSQDLQEIRKPLNELGCAALDAHYSGSSEADVRQFIDEVVIGGKDPKREERDAFFKKYLLPPNGKTAAQNIFDDIVESIWG